MAKLDRVGAPEECANCGAAIPRGAKACPECGADERTGWRETEDSIYDGLDLPGEAGPSAGSGERRQVNGVHWFWWCVGVAALVGFVALLLR